MSDKVGVKLFDKVRFKTGRSGTSFEAEVTGFEGVFVVTKDSAGKVRKVRAGACTVL